MGSQFLRSTSRVSIAAIALATCSAVHAQEAPSGGSTATESGLEDIVVTARQRGEREIDVPVATAVVTAKAMEERGLNDLQAIASQIPGLTGHTSTVASGGGIALRGIKSSETTASVEQAVSINFDGVPVSYGGIMRLGQFDLGQIEVLKGPQALYFGKNATGGILAIRSANPTRELDVMARVGYEFEADQYLLEGHVSGPLSDTVRARIAVRQTDMKGYMHLDVPPNISGGNVPIFLPSKDRVPNKEFIIKGALEFDLADRGSLMLRAMYNDQKGQTTALMQRFFCVQGVPAALGGAPYVNGTDDCSLNDRNLHGNLNPVLNAVDPRFPADGVPYTDVTQQLYVATLNYELSDTLKLISITGYYDLELQTADDIALGGVAGQVSYATRLTKKSLSHEARLQSSFDGPFQFNTGIFLQKDKYSEGQSTILNATRNRLSPYTQFNLKNATISPFAELIYNITDQFKVSGGLRYTTETKRQAILGVPANLYRHKIKFEDLSPEATVSYRPSQNVNIYATYREGYKSGGFQTEFVTLPNALAAGRARDNTFKKETVRGGELGIKAELIDRALRLQAAVFRYDYKDLQLSRFDPASVSTILQAIGAAKTEGAELSVQYAARVPGLELYGSVGYLNAVYKDYDVACYAGQTAAAGCIPNFIAPAVGGFSGVGRQLPLAPKWAGNAGATYETAINSQFDLGLNGQVTYSGSYETRAELIPNSRQKQYATVDLGATLSTSDNRWELGLIARNIFDKWYATSSGQAGGTNAPGGRTDLYAITNRGRELWLRLTFRPFAN